MLLVCHISVHNTQVGNYFVQLVRHEISADIFWSRIRSNFEIFVDVCMARTMLSGGIISTF